MKISLCLVASCVVGMSAGCSEVEESAGARLRIAHLSPDAPPVDVCLAPAGSGAWTGPLLASAGNTGGLTYGNITKYVDVAEQQYDVRIVNAGATSCATAALPDITDLPVLPDGASATIAAIGRIDGATAQPFRLAAFIDDTEVAFGKAKLRVIHAAPGTAGVAVGFGGGAVFAPFIDNVQFGSTTQANNGYFEVAPLASAEITARDIVSGRDAIAIKPVDVPAGAIVTAFAIGTAGSTSSPLDVLVCVDNDAPTALLSNCKRVGSSPERARLRIAHLSPDAPIVDVCLAPANSEQWTGPVLRALGANGVAYAQVTTYVEVPTGTYDVRVIAAGATSCATGVVPDTRGVAVTADLVATVAALGVVDPQGAAANDPGFRLQVFADTRPSNSNRASLRFIHASPGTPAVDVGLGVAHGFIPLFTSIAFGEASSEDVPAYTGAVSARLASQSTDALTVPSVTTVVDASYSLFAIGGKTGASTNPLRVLLCTDSQAPAAGSILTPCVVAP